MIPKRRRLGAPSAVVAQIGETLGQMEVDVSGFDSLPLDRVILDPENPRHLGLDRNDPRNIPADDARRDEKLRELEALEELAQSIKSAGQVQPIRVYRVGGQFQVAQGERRVLACVLAGKATVDAVIMKEKPKALRLQQLVENLQRRDIPLYRKIENIRAVVSESEKLGKKAKTAEALQEITGLKRSQAFQYLAVMAAPSDVAEALETGALTNLEFAAEIARIKDPIERIQAIKTGERTGKREAASKPKATRRGRPAEVVKLGSTPHTDIARRLIEGVAGRDRYDIDWTDKAAITKAWKQMLKDMEEGTL